ncbi:MAG: hypothetical protein MJ051_08150 [Akkermansia sp.]|nr:hypothetical protein [Akkermansia sp.]
MKKTMIAILALCGMAMADTTEYTSKNSTTSTTNNAYYNGITLNLSGSRITTDPAFAPGEAEVELISVATYIRQLDGKTGITLALTDASGTVLALSDNVVTSTGLRTWAFSNTTIPTTENIYFVFANPDSANTAIGATLTGSVTDMVRAGGTTLANYGNTDNAITCTYLGDNSSYSMTPATQNYAPKVTLHTMSIAAPEPATATLSLLALAGLASRRRRH